MPKLLLASCALSFVGLAHAQTMSRASGGAGLTSAQQAALASAVQAGKNLSDLASAASARSNLGLGSAATATTGTATGDVPVLGTSGFLPIGMIPVDGSSVSVNSSGQLVASLSPSAVGTAAFTAAGFPAARTPAVRAADVVNVQEFGAAPDWQTVSGCAYNGNAGSNLVTATCPGAWLANPLMFAAMPSGSDQTQRVLIVPGAGANGGPLLTHIVGPVASANNNELQMADNAVTTFSASALEFGTDNTDAINAAIAWGATNRSILQYGQAPYNLVDVDFPGGAGAYGATSIDATSYVTKGVAGFVFTGAGIIWGFNSSTTTDYPVVDMLGSSYLRWNSVGVIGDAYLPPTAAWQIGRTDTQNNNSSDNSAFSYALLTGNYTEAAMINEQSESSQFIADRFYNNTPYNAATPTFATAWDGAHIIPVTSKYVTDKEPMNTGESFGENSCVGCLFGGGTPQLISGSNKLTEIASYEFSTSGIGVELWQNGGTANLQTKLDLHIENITNPLLYDFFITGPSGFTSVYLPGFQFWENGSTATKDIFEVDPASSITSVEMPGAEIQIDLANLGSPTQLVANPSLWTLVSGHILEPGVGFANLNPGVFQGVLDIGGGGATSYVPLAPSVLPPALAGVGITAGTTVGGVALKSSAGYYASTTAEVTPTVTFSAPPSGTTATGHVSNIVLGGQGGIPSGGGGSGYTAGPVTFTDATGKVLPFSSTITVSSGAVATVPFPTQTGNLTFVPEEPWNIVESGGSGGKYQSAYYAIGSVAIDNPGSGYTAGMPSVTFSAGVPTPTGTAYPATLAVGASTLSTNGLAVGGAATFGGGATFAAGQTETHNGTEVHLGTVSFNDFALTGCQGIGPNMIGVNCQGNNEIDVVGNSTNGRVDFFAIGQPSPYIDLQSSLVSINTAIKTTGPITPEQTTVGALPACSASTKGEIIEVTDAASPAWNATLAGGGSTMVEGLCNGSNWTAH